MDQETAPMSRVPLLSFALPDPYATLLEHTPDARWNLLQAHDLPTWQAMVRTHANALSVLPTQSTPTPPSHMAACMLFIQENASVDLCELLTIWIQHAAPQWPVFLLVFPAYIQQHWPEAALPPDLPSDLWVKQWTQSLPYCPHLYVHLLPARWPVIKQQLLQCLTTNAQTEPVQYALSPSITLHWQYNILTLLQEGRVLYCLEYTSKEAALLERFIAYYPEPLSKTLLLQEVFGYAPDVETHTLDTHLYRLRLKLRPYVTILHQGSSLYALALQQLPPKGT